MSPSRPAEPLPALRASVGWPRALGRLLGCGLLILQGLAICGLLFPFLGAERRQSQVARFSRRMLGVLGLQVKVAGQPQAGPLMLAANHVSWLDILALNAVRPARFISKAEIRHWPLLGWLVACGGTLFIERARKRDAMRVVHQVAEALNAGDVIAFFPEGTTSDGRGLLPFHANLLQAAVVTGVPVQPVGLRYDDALGSFSPAAPYVGELSLLGSLWRVVSARDLCVQLVFLPAEAKGEPDRRALADHLRERIARVLATPSKDGTAAPQ